MNLVDESIGGTRSGNKKIFIACGIGIIILIFVIVALLAYVTTINKGVTLTIDGEKATYLKEDNGVYYIQIQGLVNSIPSNGYSYKKGNPDMPDYNGCYITNSVESTYFKVNSNEYYKILKKDDGTQEINFYSMDNPVKEIDGEIYMPLSGVEYAANVNCVQTEKTVTIESIGSIEGTYNKETQKKTYPYFVANSSIDWEVSYSNLKMLRDRLVITRDSDNSNLLGVAVVGFNDTGKKKKVTHNVVLKNEIISPRYIGIEYVEKFDLLIVETEDGKGILKFVRDDSDNVTSVKNVITPQYEDIQPIGKDLYVIAENVVIENSDSSKKTEEEVIRYGIINSNQDKVVPTEYEQIGINLAYQFTNNDLESSYIIVDKYIPVKKDDLWGLIDLNGKEVIKPTYDDIGCTATNASSNVLIIPELDAFVFKKNRTYGIASFDGEVIIQSVLNRIYIDTSKDEKTYSMIYKDKTYNVVDYIEDMEKRKSNTTTNTTTNTTNATNTTNTTNKTNTTNTTNSTKTTNTSTNKTNQTNTTNSTTNTTNKTNTTNNTTNNTNKTNTSNSTTSNTVVITNSTR